MALPVIDFSSFLDPSSTKGVKHNTALKIDQACRDVGFFYLSGHGIDQELRQCMLDNARTFFEKASPEEKQGLAIKDAGNGVGDSSRGFQRVEGGVKGAHEVRSTSRDE
jgi:isopenicillin N synthase-like dioxygenase